MRGKSLNAKKKMKKVAIYIGMCNASIMQGMYLPLLSVAIYIGMCNARRVCCCYCSGLKMLQSI